ncbi:MAG: DTW domain-containing protein [Bdellovibrionaceae bacterium]|nr:DTW domain-containing protein [Pseudobdellovibrionaceae bacterium]
MDVETYLKNRKKLQNEKPIYRELCTNCLQPQFGCYCAHVQRFDSNIDFVVLIHPIEVKRRIATGRMASLTLENSQLIMGQDYTNDDAVNAILADPNRHPVILYPGRLSKDISPLSNEAKQNLFPKGKRLTIFVIDGTWHTARKTMYHSENLKLVPRICFSPEKPSNFRVRKQPHPACVSTIEAIHNTIELIGETQGFDISTREHDKLTYVFDKMVELQLHFISRSENNVRYRRRKEPATGTC